MRYAFLTFLFIISYIIESTVFSFFPVAGVKPDLILIFVVFYALLKGPQEGVLAGLIGGLTEDIFFGHFIGLNAFPMLVTGFLFGLLEKKVYKENFFIPILTVIAATWLNQSLVFLLGLSIEGFPANYVAVFQNVIFPTLIYNSCLSPFIYGKFYKSTQKRFFRQPDY
ncbi:rod shape-determining protein MreD [Thermincola ferriacetica]|uniref:Rod shape-determining protein MreD n=1 Tax=Thermincola ferriacetica TaxID=281456 RepID=A0A0L6W1Z9_9FIRM|nr:rod shape-determining protein MreD [Thermincola ferriacetica]KNZ69565.1 rod shape-determining protein MreD [Thermincola ferriacetica]